MRASVVLGSLALIVAAPAAARAQSALVQSAAPAVSAETLRVPDGVVSRVAIDRAIAEKAWGQAASLLAAEAERRPHDARLLVLTARVFFLDAKPLNAAIALKKAEAIRQLAAGERMLLAMSYIAVGRGEWARPELERLSTADPTNVTYTYWLGRLDYDRGLYAAAVPRFRAVIAREPRHARAWDNLALCYEALNRLEEAASAYETAVAANRESQDPSPWPLLNLGALLRREGQLNRAEDLLREAVALDQAPARAHYELGMVLEQKGDAEGAVRSLQRAAAVDVTYADPFYALSRIYRRQGRQTNADAALATFQRLKDGRPATEP